MTTVSSRFINSAGAPREIPRLLQSIFATELLSPSQNLWLVSPWISDIPIIDNRANVFSTLDPRWQRNQIRLADLLAKLIAQGTVVHIATRPVRHNQQFLRAMEDLTSSAWRKQFVHEQEELHEKGLLGNDYYLGGSMNFTFNGITAEFSKEAVHFHIDPHIVSQQRMIYLHHWGG